MIETTQDAIAQLQIVKRGLMQQLLTKGIPGWHKEYKNTKLGAIPKDWKIIKLKDLCEISHGYAFKGSYMTDSETSYIVVTPTNFKIGGGFKSDVFRYYENEKTDFIDKQYIFDGNDLIVTMTDLSKKSDTLGYPAFIPMSLNKIYLHNQRLGKVNKISECIDKTFLYYLLCSDLYRKYLTKRFRDWC